MDQRVVEEKLESLRRCIRRIKTKRVSSVEVLENDWDVQDILTVNLTRAVQLCVDLASHIVADEELPPPETMAETFAQMETLDLLDKDLSKRLQGAVGFRNIAVHAYRSIDWSIVHAITHDRLDDFREFARAVSEHLSPHA